MNNHFIKLLFKNLSKSLLILILISRYQFRFLREAHLIFLNWNAQVDHKFNQESLFLLKKILFSCE